MNDKKHILLFISLIIISISLISCSGLGINNIKPNNINDTESSENNNKQDKAENDEYYADKISAGKILDYFSEIAFGSEYGESHDILCKWKTPVYYSISGNYCDEDKQLILSLAESLNNIKGFPGISEASGSNKANFKIMFIPKTEIIKEFSSADENCVGMSEFRWNAASGEIISAKCAVDPSLDAERAATVCEEFLQSMGIAKDSYEYVNSVFYQGVTYTTKPADIDWIILKLLYHPSMECGINKKTAMSSAALLVKWDQ